MTGLTTRTRGVGGRFVAGIQSMVSGEVSGFTSEIDKTRGEAIQHVVVKAQSLGANAIIGLDIRARVAEPYNVSNRFKTMLVTGRLPGHMRKFIRPTFYFYNGL